MILYYLIFAMTAILAYLECFNLKRVVRESFLCLLLFILTLFAGLRMGNPDYYVYDEIFKGIAHNQDFASADIGFNFLCWLLSFLSSNSLIMFLSVAGIAVALNLNSFQKYSPLFLVCVLYYFVHLYVLKEMIQIRAGLASAICVYSIRYLIDNKYKKGLLFIGMAMSIHLTSIVWLLVLFVQKYRLSVKALKRFFLISLFIGWVYPLGHLVKLFAGGIDERLSMYIAYGDGGYAATLGIFSNPAAIKSILILLLAFIFCERLKVHKYFQVVLYAYVIGTCWLMLFNDFAIIGARMSNILLSVEPVLVSYLLLLFSKRCQWLVLTVIVFIAYIMLTLNMTPDKITPYQFYFS